jgi:integrase
MKLPNGTGTVKKLSGHRRKPYAVIVTTGWVQLFDDTGKPTGNPKQKRKYIGYYETRKEAIRALSNIDGQSSTPDANAPQTLKIEPYKPTFCQMWEEVQSTHPFWAKTTKQNYEYAFEQCEDLHDLRIDEITYQQLQTQMNKYMSLGKTAGSCKLFKVFLSLMFNDAVKAGYIAQNPAHFVTYHATAESIKKSAIPEETIRIIANSNDARTKDIVMILIYTGMRINELLKLNKSDCHFDDSYVIGGEKTSAGKNRIIPLHPYIKPILKRFIDRKDHISYTRYVELLQADCSEIYKHKFSFHECRHTFITMANRYGIPEETVKVIVGHSTTDITAKVYTHLDPDQLVAEVSKLPAPENM